MTQHFHYTQVFVDIFLICIGNMGVNEFADMLQK